ncbi:MAG: molybdopterin molybdotransferase [Chloroflexi bacterium]|nr:MAG: molybdopterin molybdotransferase [Chloroflexota bacterium]
MPELLKLITPSAALDLILQSVLEIEVGTEKVATSKSLGRVARQSYHSKSTLPAFNKSSVDGFSVRAQDTFGASDSLPQYITVVGEVPMGKEPQLEISEGQSAIAYTGGMLAKNADSVIMVEYTNSVDTETIEVTKPVAKGENVVFAGEDIKPKDKIIVSGHTIRPQDIGALSALGINELQVSLRPKVAIISTGDELVPAESDPKLGQIRDLNSHTISALVNQAGGVPCQIGIFKDDYELQLSAAKQAIKDCDIIVFSAGSSVSNRDLTVKVFEALGEPGILAHGIAIKPGKPTILGLAKNKPLIGLPGNPVSALVVADLLLKPVIRSLMGDMNPSFRHEISALLTSDIPSRSGREDHVPVKLEQVKGVLSATPVFGKSNLIFTLVKSDGTVCVPTDIAGLYKGQTVTVRIY